MKNNYLLLCQILQTIQTILLKLPTRKNLLSRWWLLLLLALLVCSAVVTLIVCCLIYVPFLVLAEFYKRITEIRNQNKFVKRVLKI